LITILSTKKLGNSVSQKLMDADFNVVEKNFIKIKRIDFQIDTLNKFVIFTSKNAVKSILKSEFSNQLKTKKIFCVGQKTKQFLEKNDFIVQENADYASRLGQIIKEKYQDKSFSFFSGNLRKDSLPTILNESNIKWNEVVVYKTALNPIKIKKQIDGILFFSPSAVESYLTKNKLENKTCFCIGNTTAKAIENRTKNIIIASQPTVENAIEEVIKYYN
jgi:uroporphyrinogen-III synthase